MASKLLIKAAMNEAYWQAARAMCTNCGHLNDPEKEGEDWVHILNNHAGEDWVVYECYAGPIHALIEKLSEVQP